MQSQQLVQQKESQYGIALDLCSEKIAGIWAIFNRYVDHESDVFINTAKARSAFNDSIMQKSNPYDAAQSAGLIYANVRMVTESNPQLASALTAENSLASFQEAVMRSRPLQMIGWFRFENITRSAILFQIRSLDHGQDFQRSIPITIRTEQN